MLCSHGKYMNLREQHKISVQYATFPLKDRFTIYQVNLTVVLKQT